MSDPLQDLPEAIFGDAVALLADLCRISSPSGDARGLAAVADRLAAEFEKREITCQIDLEVDVDGVGYPVLVGRTRQAPGTGVLLLVGHMDTVLPARMPYQEGDRLFGSGVLDMKAGFVTLTAALDLLSKRAGHCPHDLVLLAVPDEEVGGTIAERLVGEWGGRARAVLVMEPGERRDGSETVVAGRRGLAEWQLLVRGLTAHSGLAYWEGRSALAAAAEWCWRAQGMSEPGAGATVNVARLVAGDAAFVEQLGEEHPILGTPRRRNVIPDRARAEGEIRFLSRFEADQLLDRLETLAAEVAAGHGVQATFLPGDRVSPVDPSGPGRDLTARLLHLAQARGISLVVEEDRGGVSFPNYLPSSTPIPVLDGLGPTGGGMHTTGEWLDLHSLRRRIVLLADLLESLAVSSPLP